MEKLLEYGWAFISGIFWFFLSRLTSKIDDLEKGKASQGEVSNLRQSLTELDKRADGIDHSMQLRLVPRSEYKEDVKLLHLRLNVVSEKLGEKEDRIKSIRVTTEDKK